MSVVSKIWNYLPDKRSQAMDGNAMADQLKVKKSTCKVALNSMTRAGLVERISPDIRGQGNATVYYKKENTGHITPAQCAERVQKYINNSRHLYQIRTSKKALKKASSTRVLLTVEVPGSDTATWDMDQARAVYETLKEVFG